jgi:hypothetical protein
MLSNDGTLFMMFYKMKWDILESKYFDAIIDVSLENHVGFDLQKIAMITNYTSTTKMYALVTLIDNTLIIIILFICQ